MPRDIWETISSAGLQTNVVLNTIIPFFCFTAPSVVVKYEFWCIGLAYKTNNKYFFTVCICPCPKLTTYTQLPSCIFYLLRDVMVSLPEDSTSYFKRSDDKASNQCSIIITWLHLEESIGSKKRISNSWSLCFGNKGRPIFFFGQRTWHLKFFYCLEMISCVLSFLNLGPKYGFECIVTVKTYSWGNEFGDCAKLETAMCINSKWLFSELRDSCYL